MIFALDLTKTPCILFFLMFCNSSFKVSISSKLAVDILLSKISMLLINSFSFCSSIFFCNKRMRLIFLLTPLKVFREKVGR